MDLVWTKVLALVIMLIISIIVGLLPLKARKLLLRVPGSLERSQVFLSASLCFGAGVLLGTVFLHLLPETLENVESAQFNQFIRANVYPIGELILCSGFFLMYILEEIVHLWVHRHQNDTDDHHHVHHLHSHHHNEHERPSTIFQANRGLTVSSSGPEHHKSSIVSHSDHHELEQPVASICHNHRRRCESLPSVAVLVGCDNPVICTDSLTNCTHSTLSTRMSVADSTSPGTIDVLLRSTDVATSTVSTLQSVLVILALSIHGCLEGLALGLENHNDDVWMLFAALSAHKVAIAFSIGMELLEKGVQLKFYLLYMVIFSLASPLGGLIGALALEYSNGNSAAGAITVMLLQGLSGGTILYVVFCEVLERERCKTNGRPARLVALLLGFTVMACLQLMGEHDHGGGGDAEAVNRVVYSMSDY